MPTFEIRAPDGAVYRVDAPEGATEADALAKVRESLAGKPAEPQQPQRTTIANLARQVGLTARAGMSGLGNTIGVLSDPIASTINLVTGSRIPHAAQTMSGLADRVGLPKPETATERVAQDVASTMAGVGGMAGAANQVAQSSVPMIARVGQALAANPAQQLGAAAGGSGFGGLTREQGGGAGEQFGAALLGGVLGGLAPTAASAVASRARAAIPSRQAAQTIEIQIERALGERGVEWAGLPQAVRQSIIEDAQRVTRSGGTLNPEALARLASYRAVPGATPTAGTLSGNPVLLTQEKNTAKVAANLNDPALNRLPMREFENNRALVESLGRVSGSAPAAVEDRARPMLSALQRQYEGGRKAINSMYQTAREADGRFAELDRAFFNRRVNTLLDESMTGGGLPADVRNRINALATDTRIPFDVNFAEQFKTQVAKLQRSTTDGTQRMALGLVRQALDETPISSAAGQQAQDAFNRARMLNRTVETAIERNPALGYVRDSLRDGVEPAPDRFVRDFLLSDKTTGNNARTLAASFARDGEARDAARGAIIDHLRRSARIADDGSGNFSAAGYNQELFKLSNKLGAFFDRDEIAQLRAIGNVARYEVEQPRGSAVNNSNSGAMLTALLGKVGAMADVVPFGRAAITDPARSISVRLGNRAAFDTSRALRLPGEQQPSGYAAGLPALTSGLVGLLTANPMIDDRQNR